ncbi:hypothetical protein AVEN_62356-1 [Araneus ventricosus]|uniref:Uncharacterized protein n=1 Tax=Araneus ventricosus TaxID=182803 RepID=A0A4Y2TVX3_ARAVE|nr:hypothetical protein AVEN_62356-1 [Araneus ventricosus]
MRLWLKFHSSKRFSLDRESVTLNSSISIYCWEIGFFNVFFEATPTDFVILNRGHMTRTTPELAAKLPHHTRRRTFGPPTYHLTCKGHNRRLIFSRIECRSWRTLAPMPTPYH